MENETVNVKYFENRELSWLKFNQRVLEEAEDTSVPLFERLKFVSIFSSNLDEFYMVRVGSLYDQMLLKNAAENKTHMTPSQQLTAIAKKTQELTPRVDRAYFTIAAELAKNGIEHINISELLPRDEEFLCEYFKKEILPLLFPSVIDRKHPIPFLSNKALYVGVRLRRKNSDKKTTVVGIIPAESKGLFGRIIYLPAEKGLRFVLVEELIMHLAELVFTDFDVIDRGILRVTRNADIDANEADVDFETEHDFRDVMAEVVKQRKKLCPVRLEYINYSEEEDIELISEKVKLEIGTDFIFKTRRPLDMSFIFELETLMKTSPSLFFPPLSPQPPTMINPSKSIIKQVDSGDILLSYPYESINPFISLLNEAAENEDVVSIKITLYRVARNSRIIDALINAVENGKSVLALVELRARFDEENNIGWSKRLEDAGVQVIYGLDNLKVHSKLLLITRKIGSEIKYITQVGTGNYNERTSKLYTDFTLITADTTFGTDASMVFNALSVGSTVESSTKLWVAPNCLKSRVIEMIDREITFGEDGYIGLKLNSLTDKDIIEKLVEANEHKVKVELVIRGINCLISGIEGKTDNIKVVSIVGRFLEHSRIYIFGKENRRKVFISSADFMTRNTERRVEVAAPLNDAKIADRICSYFNICMRDNVKARIQTGDGSYHKKITNDDPLNSQEYFYKQAYTAAAEMKAEQNNRQSDGGLLKKIKRLFSK